MQHFPSFACRSNGVTIRSGCNPKAAAFDTSTHDSVSLTYVYLEMKQGILLNDCFYIAIHFTRPLHRSWSHGTGGPRTAGRCRRPTPHRCALSVILAHFGHEIGSDIRLLITMKSHAPQARGAFRRDGRGGPAALTHPFQRCDFAPLGRAEPGRTSGRRLPLNPIDTTWQYTRLQLTFQRKPDQPKIASGAAGRRPGSLGQERLAARASGGLRAESVERTVRCPRLQPAYIRPRRMHFLAQPPVSTGGLAPQLA
jgi:hypothetical protein